MIVIPQVAKFNPEAAAQMATANFAPNQIQVSVVGEVKDPGAVMVRPSTSLNQALLVAGGFNDDRADRSSVDLVRLNPDGTVSTRTVEIDFSQSINDQTNPLLQNNDVIVVRRSGFAKFFDPIDQMRGSANAMLSFVTIPLRIVEIIKDSRDAFDDDEN